MAIPADDHELSLRIVRMHKLFQSLKAYAPRIHDRVDPTAYPLLFSLIEEPRRVGTLADCIHSDISTVSRQVTALVGHGLIAKVPDPQDGRAQMVTLTEEGHRLVAELRERRTVWFRGLLDGWSDADVKTFSDYVERFNTALEQARVTGAAAHASPAAPAEGPTPPSHLSNHPVETA